MQLYYDFYQSLELFFTMVLSTPMLIFTCCSFHASWGRHGRDHMVIGFTTTCAISAYHN
jgi:hypothetical protein